MKLILLILMTVMMLSCSSNKDPIGVPVDKPDVSVPQDETIVEMKPDAFLTLMTKTSLWATYYNMPSLTQDPNGYHVRDMRDNSLGVKLSKKDFCSLAMEGSGYINGKTYNYAGTTQRRDVSCSHSASSYVKFYVTEHAYGVGNKNNPLVPFFSIACDQRKFKFGQVFYIPEALGTLLPNGMKHDGYFRCDDVGGLIKDNHIDVFIGAATKNPFSFIKSTSSKTFTAYLQ